MASRLDRLVKLLETGSTPLIRNTAAQQLGDAQKQHPDELFNLLARVVPYLRHHSWDVRVSAAKALGCILENTLPFDPNADDEVVDCGTNTLMKESEFCVEDSSEQSLLQLDCLDTSAIVTNGLKLVASGSDPSDELASLQEPNVRLDFKRRTVSHRLGLHGSNVAAGLASVVSSMKIQPVKPMSVALESSRQPIPHINTYNLKAGDDDGMLSPDLSSMRSPPPSASIPNDQNSLSKRQLNQLKRKQKLDAKSLPSKVRVLDLSSRRQSLNGSHASEAPHAGPDKLKVKTEVTDEPEDMFSIQRGAVEEEGKFVAEFKGIKDISPEKSIIETKAEQAGLEWPFERLCDMMAADIFDPAWEIRQGAAMGLREIVRTHGHGAGRESGKTRKANDKLHDIWADDLACRLCGVLMLDRFGDYISDNVVAPIRETVGQTLGALMAHLSVAKVTSIYKVLHQMILQTHLTLPTRVWEVCHGGMIGLRYLVAVRGDLLTQEGFIDGVIEAVTKGLTDLDDDVRAVSAATLIPISKEFVTLRPLAIPEMINVVWACLSDLRDDLSASTGFLMDLLAKLCGFSDVLGAMRMNAIVNTEHSFTRLVPRLYPFLRHTIITVRLAVLRALHVFVGIADADTSGWITGLAIRLVFQNLLVEKNVDNLSLSLEVFTELMNHLNTNERVVIELTEHADDMCALALHPMGTSRNNIPVEMHNLLKPSGQPFAMLQLDHRYNGEDLKRRRRSKVSEVNPTSLGVDGHMLAGDIDLVQSETLTRSRIFMGRGVGYALSLLASGPLLDQMIKRLKEGLTSSNSSTQMQAGIIIAEWAALSQNTVPDSIKQGLFEVIDLERPGNYGDILPYLRIVRSQCQNLLNVFRDFGHLLPHKLPALAAVVQGEAGAGPAAFTVSNAQTLLLRDYELLRKALSPANRITASKVLSDAHKAAQDALSDAIRVKQERDIRIKAASAHAIINMGDIPRKPSSLIKSVMDSIKSEENKDLQNRSADAIAILLKHYSSMQKRGPADKIAANLASFYCMDTSETPEFVVNSTKKDVVLSLHKEEDRKDYTRDSAYEQEASAARITRRGTKRALDRLCSMFGSELFDKVPVLYTKTGEVLKQALKDELFLQNAEVSGSQGQDIVDALSILRALVPTMSPDLKPVLVDLMLLVAKALRCKLAVLRYAAAKCFASICNTLKDEGMSTLVNTVLPYASSDELHCRQGVIEVIYHLIHVMEDAILPYVIFLIVPVLGRMSDADSDIRLIATTTFATLVKLVPLEAGIPDPPGFSASLLAGRDRERKFMSQMLDIKKLEPFVLPVDIRAELRSYQQEGLNWLAFLNRYHLHGILCDDMGLGKTLQTLCIVASDHHMRAAEFAKNQSSDARRLPSLIICPPTLSGHWQQEISQFAPFLTCLAYVGTSQDRGRYRSELGKTDIVITSYDVCRNDIDLLLPIDWNYCVLDEGHLIKNPKAKISIAAKRIKSNHRLILSGTPIQNNVLELWSLFDFLMPGFLGSEKVFLDRFARPIAASRNAKSSSKEQEIGALAIEALHKQVLPFLLRRLKEEVLDDLPPKIVQNYYCDLSELQKKLFDDFAKRERSKVANEVGSGTKEAKQHIFQALQHMRKLCNSPALVIKENHRQYAAVQAALAKQNSSLRDIAHAPKLGALRDLLLDCGIGADPSTSNTFVSPHRALIFCQMKEMLDIVATTVFKELLPGVQYLRLDGSVEASRRQGIVNRFNTDPSFDCLLLTTSVGGLGLNLTGADTVIFVEHDWNPQKDIQAMDRAHRIGQKKVVNVYRLITRGTLEEKILNLQRFKIDVASTVVNQQNAGLATMETDQILDLFNISSSEAGSSAGMLPPPPARDANNIDRIGGVSGEEVNMVDATTGQVKEKGKKGWMDDLGELWDEKGYEQEFDLGGFLKTMKM